MKYMVDAEMLNLEMKSSTTSCTASGLNVLPNPSGRVCIRQGQCPIIDYGLRILILNPVLRKELPREVEQHRRTCKSPGSFSLGHA